MSKELFIGGGKSTSATGNSIIPASTPSVLGPEEVELTNMYFECGMDAQRTAFALSIPLNKVVEMIKSPAVSSYISTLVLEQGYMNRHKLFGLLDGIVEKKLAELEDNEMTSGKDIMDILGQMHKMRMDEMAMQLKMQELEIKRNKTSVNVSNATIINQNNPSGQSGNLGNLLNSLLQPKSQDVIQGN